jgi:hypothetical protein
MRPLPRVFNSIDPTQTWRLTAPRTFNVYCDESCHLEHDHIPVMAWGAVSCPAGRSLDRIMGECGACTRRNRLMLKPAAVVRSLAKCLEQGVRFPVLLESDEILLREIPYPPEVHVVLQVGELYAARDRVSRRPPDEFFVVFLLLGELSQEDPRTMMQFGD